MAAFGGDQDGYLVYHIILGTAGMEFYNVMVDPGNGQIFATEVVPGDGGSVAVFPMCRVNLNLERLRFILLTRLAAAIRLNISGVISSRGDNIKYVYTDTNHTDPLQRITPFLSLILISILCDRFFSLLC